MSIDHFEEDTVDLVDYFKVILKHKWVIVGGTFVSFLMGIFFQWTKPVTPTYEANASVAIISPPLKSELLTNNFPVEMYRKLAENQDVKQEIISTLGLTNKDGQPLSILALGGAMEVKVVAEEESSFLLLNLFVTTTDTLKLPPVPIVNTWAEVYVNKNRGISSSEALGSYEYINEQYQLTKTNLDSITDVLVALNNKRVLESLRSEFSAKQSRLVAYENRKINFEFQLQDTQESLREHELLVQTSETIDGIWIGDLKFAQKDLDTPHYLTRDQRKIRQEIIQARDQYAQILEDIRQFELTQNLEFEEQLLTHKRRRLSDVLSDQQNTHFEAATMAQTLKEISKTEKLQQTGISFSNSDIWREWVSISAGYNLFEPRKIYLAQERKRLKTQIDSMKVALDGKRESLGDLNEKRALYEHYYMLFKPGYLESKKQVFSLRNTLQRLNWQYEENNKKQQGLHTEVNILATKVSKLEIKREQLVRDQQILQKTFEKFSNLLEDARVAKAKQPDDVKIVSRAVMSYSVPSGKQPFSPVFIAAIGLIISLAGAFLIEYFQRAQAQLKRD